MFLRDWIRRLVARRRARIEWIRTPEPYKRQISVHEAGHVVAAWLLPTFTSVDKATVLPEGPHRGYTLATHVLSDPPEVREIEHLMTLGMAGATAERLLIGRSDAGSTDDMIHVLAWWLHGRYGTPRRGALGIAASLMIDMLSDDPFRRISARLYAVPVLAHAAGMAVELLRHRRAELEAVAAELRKRRTIGHRHLEKLLGPRPS